MKKQLMYEAKRILLPLLIFTAIACVLYILTALNTDFILTRYKLWQDPAGLQADELVPYDAAGNPLTGFVCAILLVLCFVAPVMQYSYRMKKRSVDLWYSLPVTRTKLMLVRTIGGLALVLIPYILSYWLGFAVIACSDNLFELLGRGAHLHDLSPVSDHTAVGEIAHALAVPGDDLAVCQ